VQIPGVPRRRAIRSSLWPSGADDRSATTTPATASNETSTATDEEALMFHVAGTWSSVPSLSGVPPSMSMRSYRLRLTGKQGTASAEVKRQTGRDLTRFDLDFDLPDRFLPKFPAPIYLTTRPDLGDMSRGQPVTTDNYYEFFSGILNPKTAGRTAAPAHSAPPEGLQRHGRPSERAPEPGRGLLRLPPERPHQRGHPPGGGHPAPAVPASDRDENLSLASRSGTPPRRRG
jgi:hypothetical protein